MRPSIKDEWVQMIIDWAASKPEIAELYLYGSRVKGTNRDDSDLDVAILIEGEDGLKLATWIIEGRLWAEELDALLDVEIHLEAMNEGDNNVLPAVRDHGLKLYSKPSPPAHT
jgi:predicted nucleotidyltransferase